MTLVENRYRYSDSVVVNDVVTVIEHDNVAKVSEIDARSVFEVIEEIAMLEMLVMENEIDLNVV